MIYNTEAVVIRSIAYGETDAILTLLTPEGTVAALARGAKKPRSRLAAGAQLCVRGMYTLYQNRGMGSLNQAEVLDGRRAVREDLDVAAYAAYFCELVRAVAEERPHGQQAVFTQLNGALDRLTADAASAGLAARVWESKILRMSGSSPTWTVCVRCGETLSADVFYSAREGGFVCTSCRTADATSGLSSQLLKVPSAVPRILETFSTLPWTRLGTIRVSDDTKSALTQILRAQMVDFAGFSLKSRHVLESLQLE